VRFRERPLRLERFCCRSCEGVVPRQGALRAPRARLSLARRAPGTAPRRAFDVYRGGGDARDRRRESLGGRRELERRGRERLGTR